MNTSQKQPAKVLGIQFSILSPDEIRAQSVAKITSKETYINGEPQLNGLFDPRMGTIEPGIICPTDGLDYMKTPGYFGHLELARPVLYIQYLSIILKILKCVCFKCSKILIDKNKYSNLLKLSSKDRWDSVCKLCTKVKRCGDVNDNGCGCKQPDKIKKEGLSTIIAEWSKLTASMAEKTTLKLTPENIITIFRRISDKDIEFLGFSPLWSRPEWMICQVLAVPPPAIRPSVKHDAQQRSEDDITHIIINIIKANNTLFEKINQNANQTIIDDWTTMLQFYIATMVNNKIPGVHNITQRSGRPLKSITERLNGKFGRVRGNLMGKRVDFSARSVITPDASIGIKELGVPIKIAMNLTYPELVNSLNINYLKVLVKNGPDVYPGANIIVKKNGDNISLRYTDRNSIILEIGDVVNRHMIDGDPVLFNRQPTLHRMSMMAHITKVMTVGSSFRMNVADTKPYNADFDGDEMNLHKPQNEESVSELLNLAAVKHHIISPGNNKPIIGIYQDSLLGSYLFSRDDVKFDRIKAMNLIMRNTNIDTSVFVKETISNMDILSQLMPAVSIHNGGLNVTSGEYISGRLNAGSTKKIIHYINNDIGCDSAVHFIDDLQNVITQYMKSNSYSVGISDLISNKQTKDNIIEVIMEKKRAVKELSDQILLGTFENTTGKENVIEYETKVNNILNKAQEEAGKIGKKSLSNDNRFVIMIKSGSKGKDINIAQMISCLGQQNVDGKRIPYGYENRTLPHYTKYDDSPEARGFVENSFIDGLTPQELFFHAMGGRVGLIDTAIKTSQTGYIQRRLIKGMEDVKIEYDMTVRNNMKKIIQFQYGSDGFSTVFVESQKLPIVSMNIEDIYEHFTIPKNNFNQLIFEVRVIPNIKKQKDELNETTLKYINLMLDNRDVVAKNVFNMKNENVQNIYLPVNFNRIISTVKDLCKINNTSVVDITPLDVFKMIENTFNNLETPFHKHSKLFRLMYFYYLSPKKLLIDNRFYKDAIVLLLNKIELQYKKSIVNPGEMVGLICAQSIGEPATQMTLNTFHFAGVASKSNVLRGVPRIEEILSLSSSPKNPSVTVVLKDKDKTDIQRVQEIMYKLELTTIKNIVSASSIYFDPYDNISNVKEDEILMKTFSEYSNLFSDVLPKEKYSKWVIRLEMSKEQMLYRNISMDDIYFAINNSYNDNVSCVYSDLNADNLIFRIRIKDLIKKKTSTLNGDATDEIYILNNILDNILNNITIKGVSNIDKVTMRKIQDTVRKENGNYISDEHWVLDTAGTNLLNILGKEYINPQKTISNDIMEVYKIFGIEAARQAIYNELIEVVEFDGTYINYHNIGLLCDRMCVNYKMTSMFRHGINNDNIGPLAKASFEETPEMFFRAARHGELDNMRGVSANVMLGQQGKFGTSSFDIILDIDMIKPITIFERPKERPIEESFDIDDPNDKCSLNKISINNSVGIGSDKYTGEVPSDYDMNFKSMGF